MKKIFLTEELNAAGLYALQMYVMGIPVTVVVDDFLPFWDYGEKPDDFSMLVYG